MIPADQRLRDAAALAAVAKSLRSQRDDTTPPSRARFDEIIDAVERSSMSASSLAVLNDEEIRIGLLALDELAEASAESGSANARNLYVFVRAVTAAITGEPPSLDRGDAVVSDMFDRLRDLAASDPKLLEHAESLVAHAEGRALPATPGDIAHRRLKALMRLAEHLLPSTPWEVSDALTHATDRQRAELDDETALMDGKAVRVRVAVHVPIEVEPDPDAIAVGAGNPVELSHGFDAWITAVVRKPTETTASVVEHGSDASTPST